MHHYILTSIPEFVFSCSWLADRWEECTSTCGANGIRSRQIYCVPNSTIFRANTTFENGENILSNEIRYLMIQIIYAQTK